MSKREGPSKRWSDKSGFQFERAIQGVTNEWLTPPSLVRALGKFELDPCAAVDQPWKLARRQYTIEQDGLKRRWTGRVFCNPPYGRDTRLWVRKMISHDNGILLIFARVETRAFFDLWESASSMLFLAGRLSFHFPTGELSPGKPAASVLVAFDPPGSHWNTDALRDSGLRGSLVTEFGVINNA